MFEQDLAPVCLCGSLQGVGHCVALTRVGVWWGGGEVVEEDVTSIWRSRGGRQHQKIKTVLRCLPLRLLGKLGSLENFRL